MSDLDIPKNIPYRIRRNLVTEMAGATADDHAPAFRDSHEASQDQAEEAADERDRTRAEVTPLVSTPFSFSSEDTEFDEETGDFVSMKLRCPLCGPTKRDPHQREFEADSTYTSCYHVQRVHAFVVCTGAQNYTDQQVIAGRATHASFTWLNRERDEVGKYKERRLARSGGTMTSSIVPMVFAPTELNLKGRAELLPLIYEGHNVKIMVRPQHPVTKHAMTSRGEVARRLPLCSDLLHTCAMGLVAGNPMALTKMDPLNSPDLLFPMPDRATPRVIPKDSGDWDEVKFVSEKQVIEQMAGKSLAQGIGPKVMPNFTRLMRYTFGAKTPEPKTPRGKSSAVKQEVTSPHAPAQEFDGEYEGYVPEGRFVSSINFVRSYVNAFAERIKTLWVGKESDPINQPFIPRKSPMIFRCSSK